VKDVAFDSINVFFTGVSGGSLLLSGFLVPAFGAQYMTGVVLNCGALVPQVNVPDAGTLVSSMKIHFQSTSDELALLQPAIPAAIKAYEALAMGTGLSAAQVGMLQTVDNTPNGGGHCGFDGKGFVSGVQLMASLLCEYHSGLVTVIGNVLAVSTPCFFRQDANELAECSREGGCCLYQCGSGSKEVFPDIYLEVQPSTDQHHS